MYVALVSATSALAQVSAVTSTTFTQIQKYTLFAAASYAENCPTPPQGSRIVKFFNDTASDTQAVLFQAGNEQILSFRGSSSPKDLDTDFNFTMAQLSLPGTSCDNCFVHTGFQGALATILPAIQSSLGSGPLTITGHSLGGALASIAASALKPSKVYTFGEPRNGDSDFADYLEGIVTPANYFRVTHYNDGVPQIPPTILGYTHHGTEYWESSQTGNTAASTKKLSGREPTVSLGARRVIGKSLTKASERSRKPGLWQQPYQRRSHSVY